MPITTPGNINLFSRPRVIDPESGKIATVLSMSFDDGNGEILVPRVERTGKRILSDEEAIKQYYATGEHLGKFTSVEEANAFGSKLHHDMERGVYDVPLATSRRDVGPAVLERVLMEMYLRRGK